MSETKTTKVDPKRVDPFTFCKANVMQHETGHLFMANSHNIITSSMTVAKSSGQIVPKNMFDIPSTILIDLCLGGPIAGALLYDREDYECLWWLPNNGDMMLMRTLFERENSRIGVWDYMFSLMPSVLATYEENDPKVAQERRFHAYIKKRWGELVVLFKNNDSIYHELLKEVGKLDFDGSKRHTLPVPSDIMQIKMSLN